MMNKKRFILNYADFAQALAKVGFSINKIEIEKNILSVESKKMCYNRIIFAIAFKH